MEELILKLHKIGAIKFGNFEIKRDFFAPLNLDLTGVISHPQMAKELGALLWEKAQHLPFDLFLGTPVVGSCFATYLSWENEKPLLVYRPEAKEHTHKIEGSYKSGQKCLILHDILLQPNPLLDLIDDLKEEGLQVTDLLCLFDWEMGAKQKLRSTGLIPHTLIKMHEVIQILYDAKKIPGDSYKLAGDFLESVQNK